MDARGRAKGSELRIGCAAGAPPCLLPGRVPLAALTVAVISPSPFRIFLDLWFFTLTIISEQNGTVATAECSANGAGGSVD